MRQLGLRRVGADRPTTLLVSSLGSYRRLEGSDMVELEEAGG